MAHLRNIEKKCAACPKRATVALYDGHNTYYEDYCAACGKKAQARLQAEEDAARNKVTQ